MFKAVFFPGSLKKNAGLKKTTDADTFLQNKGTGGAIKIEGAPHICGPTCRY